MNSTITIRLNAIDAANIVTIADAMRSARYPFVTRSDAVKLAIKRLAEQAFKGVIGEFTVPPKAKVIDASLVILDNFSTLAEVADENEAAAMSPVLTFLLRMKQAGRATILVHHSDKTGSNYRGSSKLATTFEVIIGLYQIEGRAVGDGAGFELRWTKYRGKPTVATRDIEATLQDVPDGGVKWDQRPAAGAEMMALVDAVRSGKFQTQRELAEHLHMEPSKVTRLKGRAFGKQAISKVEWEACMAGEGVLNPDF